MAITKLPTNYQDDIIDTSVTDKRKYNFIENSDGTKSLEDVTAYTQIGSDYGATEINAQNQTINELIDLAEQKTADRLTNPVKINGVDFDGSSDIVIEDDTKLSNDKDFVLVNKKELKFENNVCNISDSRITADSLADVYFTTDTISIAEKATITVETYSGYVSLKSNVEPTGKIIASIHIRVV